MKHKIYKLVDLDTNECLYVGRTTKTLKERFLQHYNNEKSKDKYDWMHTHRVGIYKIKEVDNKEEAILEEERNIVLYDTIKHLNKRFEIKKPKSSRAGYHAWVVDETLKKMKKKIKDEKPDATESDVDERLVEMFLDL